MRLERCRSVPKWNMKDKECDNSSSPTTTEPMAQHGFGFGFLNTPLSAPSCNSTSCPGTYGVDTFATYPVRERDPQAYSTQLHYMAISCMFASNRDLKWSLEELRLQDYLNRQSAGSTKGASTTTSNDNKPGRYLIIRND